MSVGLRLFLLAVSLLAGAVVLARIRKSKMQIEDSVFWVLCALLFILLAAFPPILYKLTELFGVQSPANLLFLHESLCAEPEGLATRGKAEFACADHGAQGALSGRGTAGESEPTERGES